MNLGRGDRISVGCDVEHAVWQRRVPAAFRASRKVCAPPREPPDVSQGPAPSCAPTSVLSCSAKVPSFLSSSCAVDAWTLAFSPDSQYLATGTHVGKVNIFGVESGKKEYSLDTRGKFILSIAYVRRHSASLRLSLHSLPRPGSSGRAPQLPGLPLRVGPRPREAHVLPRVRPEPRRQVPGQRSHRRDHQHLRHRHREAAAYAGG